MYKKNWYVPKTHSWTTINRCAAFLVPDFPHFFIRYRIIDLLQTSTSLYSNPRLSLPQPVFGQTLTLCAETQLSMTTVSMQHGADGLYSRRRSKQKRNRRRKCSSVRTVTNQSSLFQLTFMLSIFNEFFSERRGICENSLKWPFFLLYANILYML